MLDNYLEDQYAISKHRPDFVELMQSWAARAGQYRAGFGGQLDIAYGSHPREKLDLFLSDVEQAPLLVYFHGGYWQRGDKSMYSFIAQPFVENGVDVAVVGYPLCPEVSLTTLVESVRRSLVYLFKQAQNLKINREQFNLCGNSAGGHLVAMMMSTDFTALDSIIPKDLIRFGAPMSTLFTLEPLMATSLNEALKLDVNEARQNSPQYSPPLTNAPMLAAVGGAETKVFFEQTDIYINQWQNNARLIETFVEVGADHFDMIERLGDAESALFQAVLQRIDKS